MSEYRSPNDPLTRHHDFDDLMARRKKGGPNVVTHHGWQDPTQRQLTYITKRADELGISVPTPKTRQGAKRSIDSLLRKQGTATADVKGAHGATRESANDGSTDPDKSVATPEVRTE